MPCSLCMFILSCKFSHAWKLWLFPNVACGLPTWGHVSHLLRFWWVLNLECVTLSHLSCPPMKCFISCASTINRTRYFFPDRPVFAELVTKNPEKMNTSLDINKKKTALPMIYRVFDSVCTETEEKVSFLLYTRGRLDVRTKRTFAL